MVGEEDIKCSKKCANSTLFSVICFFRQGNCLVNTFLLNPFVPGGWGENTIVQNWDAIHSGRSRVHDISKLHISVNVWLGDELLEVFPCHIVTIALADRIERYSLSGVEFEEMEVTNIQEEVPGLQFDPLPSFRRLRALGKAVIVEDGDTKFITEWSGHDFCLTASARLVVSEKALRIIEKHNMENCGVIPLDASLLK